MLAKAVNENRTDIARFLIDNGTPVPPKAHLLHRAVASDNMDMILLLKQFYSVSDRDDHGDTPLHRAGSEEIAQLLIDWGAAVDAANAAGEYPHETATGSARDFLRRLYDELHPAEPPAAVSVPAGAPDDWERRFSLEALTVQDLVPTEDGDDPEHAAVRFNGREYRYSKRFFSSLARKMKFSTNVFNYFSPQEFLSRVAERHPDLRFQATFDNHTGEILGVVDPEKKLLPAHLACKVIAEDPRTRKITYREGIWEAEMMLDEKFSVPRAGDYYRKLQLNYPVDGVGMPSIYLATVRVVCSNGAVAVASAFRTDIEVNDESGTHLGKLIKSFSNDYGFSVMGERLIAAQNTIASVNELLNIDALIAANVSDKSAYRRIHDRLNDIAGDPCYQYGVTSLQSIPRKKQTLLPVACSVNDLLNICSELTTHHGEILHRPQAFNEKTGQMLSQEFDLEGIYHAKGDPSPDFFLSDLNLSGRRAAESVERENDLVYANE